MTQAEIAQNTVWVRNKAHLPIYVWYEWVTWGSRFHINRYYEWEAKAWCSNEPAPDRRGGATPAAWMAVSVGVAPLDHAETWKLKGVDIANETLDNLVMLFCMQNDKTFEIQRRLVGVPL